MIDPRNDALRILQRIAEQLAAWSFATELGCPPTADEIMIQAQQIQDYLTVCETRS
jgi:hypothetical protein